MKKIKKMYRNVLRTGIVRKYRKKLKNSDFTIISSNCIGGLIYHDFGLQFKSPTINMYIESADFVKLCKDLKYYMSQDVECEEQDKYDFPVLRLGDILLYCVHYKSFEEAKEKWNERKKRVNYDNIYLIMTERDGCKYEDILEFDKLNYKHKVIFVHREMEEIKSAYYIPGTENNNVEDRENKVINLTEYQGKFTGKKFYEEFDILNFINNKE